MHRMFSARNLPITSELTGDTWLDLIDGYLCAGSPNEYQVPFYPAVYAGYATYFGCEEDLKDPEETFNAWQSMYFVWGVVPGDFDRWRLGSPEFRRQQALIGRFAELCMATRGRYERVALATDARQRGSFEAFWEALDELKALMEKGVGDGKKHHHQAYNCQASLDPDIGKKYEESTKGRLEGKE